MENLIVKALVPKSMRLDAKKVFVDFQFDKIGEIDNMNDKYCANISFQLSWIENQVIENYNKDEHWNPQISIENIFSKVDDIVVYETKIIDGNTTEVIEKHQIKGHFWERFEIHNFPHDVQELSISLVSKHESAKVKFEARDCSYKMNISTYIDQQKWELLNLVEVKPEKIDYSIDVALQSPSKIIFRTFACRHPSYYYVNAYLLIFLVTVTSIGMFAIDYKLPQNRLQTTATVLLTSVSFKWAINRAIPPVNYTTNLDQYSIVSIFYLCLSTAYHALIGAFSKYPNASQVDIAMLCILSALFVCIQTFFCIKAIRSHLIVVELRKRVDLTKNKKTI